MSTAHTPALAGQHVLVTGGSSGIGKACADRYRAEGATVFVADLHPTSSDEIQLDVSDPAAWAELAERLPALDVVHLNAGIATPGRAMMAEGALPLSDVTDDAYRTIFGANVDGVFFGVRAVLPKMVEHGGGQILVTASMAGLGPIPGDPVYGATKHAVVGLVRSLGPSLDPYGVCIERDLPRFRGDAARARGGARVHPGDGHAGHRTQPRGRGGDAGARHPGERLAVDRVGRHDRPASAAGLRPGLSRSERPMSPFPPEDLVPLPADDDAVRALARWQAVDGRLRARYDTRSFAVGLALVNGIGAAAEAADHHPDIDLRYGHVVVVTWSHDVDAITARDVRLAAEIDAIADELGIADRDDEHGDVRRRCVTACDTCDPPREPARRVTMS